MKEFDDIPKNNPFRVPENYFGNLTERIISGTTAVKASNEKKGIVRKLRPFILAAASVAILAVAGYAAFYLSGGFQKGSMNETAASGRYNNIYVNDIDVATLEENVAGNEYILEIPDVNRNELIDYLLSEDVNILDIYEQL
jgi:hypothetical protein